MVEMSPFGGNRLAWAAAVAPKPGKVWRHRRASTMASRSREPTS